MFAARADQENAVHQRQTAAAAKQLNQGVPGLTAKTPGNRAPKTPFKVSLNDENEVEKTKGKKLGGKQQGAKPQKSLFQTPAPRDRPALGFKTTNARATAFQTPAPKVGGPSPEKTQRKTAGRSRIQIHKEVKEAEPEIDWGQEEIQYIPPKPIPLPDVPSDDEWDKFDFSILKQPANLASCLTSQYLEKCREEEEAEARKTHNEEWARLRKEADELPDQILEQLWHMDSDEEDPASSREVTRRKPTNSVGTVAARSAASALSRPNKPSAVPSYAAPTAATKARVPFSNILGHKKAPSTSGEAVPARVATHNTLGYAKGRAVSHSIRQPLTGVFKDEQQIKPKKRDPVKELEEIVRMKEYEAMGLTEEDIESIGSGGVPLDEEDEEVFQMTIPEDMK